MNESDGLAPIDRIDMLLAKPRAALTAQESRELHCLLFNLDDSPANHRDPVSPDVLFLRACGIRAPDFRDSLLVLDQ